MLQIDPQTVYMLVLKAREFDDLDLPGEPDPDDGPEDTVVRAAMNYYANNPIAQEIKDMIDGLNDDEQADLVALTWIGRGDYSAEEWQETVNTARQRRTNPTSDYLLGTPLLGDYLEEGLIHLGFDLVDLEPAAV